MSDTLAADYFSLFGLESSFDIDVADLEKRYFTAQRSFHPDRVGGKSPAERNAAIGMSMRVNEAYDALKSPLSRAKHLLALHGIQVGGEQDSQKPSPALLMEVLESREALAEAQTLVDVEAIETISKATQTEVLTQLSAAFAQRQWPQAAELTIRLGYLLKLADEIRIRRKFFVQA
jgi:molecular chaperone HscB